MSGVRGGLVSMGLLLLIAGCDSGARPDNPAAPRTTASTSPADQPALFPTQAFAEISNDPVSEEAAVAFEAVLDEVPDGVGMTATVMSTDGSWSGATGKADGIRDLRVEDQFAIASITKSVVAAQVMQLVDAGELALDDPAAQHLPPMLDFDTNGATIRQLLNHRSGIPWYDASLFDPDRQESPSKNRKRVWTPAEMLALVPDDRAPVGQSFEYTNPNYLLLGLVLEHVRGRPVADVLRDGVLRVEGAERLIYQPDEVPTPPMAMPFGRSTDALEQGGGILPSLAGATSDGPAAAMASDAPSLAHWWRAFCAGEVVSQASLTEMTTFADGYGLGLYDVADPFAHGVGHSGEHIGYRAWAGCLPEEGTVVVVLSNEEVDTSSVAGSLTMAADSDAP